MSTEALYGPEAFYVLVAVLLIFRLCFDAGRGQYDFESGGTALLFTGILSILWPIVLAVLALIAPFYGVYRLGRWVAKKTPQPKEAP